MSSYDDDHDSFDDGPVPSHEAVTPRGGFMARPGLKSPPRHAVVVRVGDVPESEGIPLARASVPPPAPPSDPPPVSASEKITLRAIPTPSTPPPAVEEAPQSMRQRAVESFPPPSDAPVVQSVRPSASSASRSRRSTRSSSRWTIVIAAAAGLLLGLASVLTTMRAQRSPGAAAIAAPTLEAPHARPAPRSVANVAPSASARPMNAAGEPANALLPPASRPANQGAKRSIF